MMDAVDVAAQQIQEISGRYPNRPVEVLGDGALLWRVAPGTMIRFEARLGWRDGELLECTPSGVCSIRVGEVVVSVKWDHLRIIPGAGKTKRAKAAVAPVKPLPDQLRQRARALVGAGYDIAFVQPLVDAAARIEKLEADVLNFVIHAPASEDGR